MKLSFEKIKKPLIGIAKISGAGLLSLLLIFLGMNFIFPIKDKVAYATIVESSDGSMLKAFLSADDKWRMMTELDEISPALKTTIIHKEDKYFYWHLGVNPVSVLRAAFNNLVYHKRTSGASTITMQVARLLQPKQRTYFNKLIEIFRAFQLEWKYSKDEILQLYLNLVPYGGNIEGIKAASYIYFEKPPQQLSLGEVTALTIIPNKPNTLRPGANNNLLVNERNKWLYRFQQEGLFGDNEIRDALNEPLQMSRHNLPDESPHFCQRLQNQFPGNAILKSTLNRNMQLTIEKIVGNASSKLKMMNINNAAVLVINNKTKAVEAYIGSANFNDTEDGGQVDGVRAIRSPGSTLKPLLYATAFDKGLLTTKTRILDVPINVQGYFPENYDQTYHGSVTVEYALINSLNIPACKTLDDVGVKNFIDKLKAADFTAVHAHEKDLGLSVILGGCGATLEQLGNMYSSLANAGTYSRLRYLQNEKAGKSFQLVSPAASFMVGEILAQMHRPDLPYNFQNSTHLPKVAWKTGTSYGRRDAWSIGYNTRYTVAVWVGNFSGKGVPELNGAEMATPVLFEVFNTIDYNKDNIWFKTPAQLDYRLVCSESGKIPESFCDNKIMDAFIPSVSPNEKCSHKKNVFVSNDDKISYCTGCMNTAINKSKLYNYYQPELIAWMSQENISYEKIPPHNTLCDRSFIGDNPVITSPVNGLEFYLDKKEQQKLLLSCNAAPDVAKVFWFVNDKVFANGKPDEHFFFEPVIGKSKITCTDDKGRSKTVSIECRTDY